MKAGKKVMLFFSNYRDPENTIPSEESEVLSFREKMKRSSDCIDYNGNSDIAKMLFEELTKV